MTTAEGERERLDQSLQDKAPKHYWSLSNSTQTNGTIKRDTTTKQNKTNRQTNKQTKQNKTKTNEKKNKIKHTPTHKIH